MALWLAWPLMEREVRGSIPGRGGSLFWGKIAKIQLCALQIIHLHVVGDANSVRKKPDARPRKAPVSAVPHDKAVALAACRQPGGCRRILYIGSERKNSVRKTGEHYKHRPSTAYGAFQPHTRAKTRVPGQWVGYSRAVPRCHNSVGQMGPGRAQLLLLLRQL